MSNYFLSAIFGLVQGLTEFWPISSSGHLLILHEILSASGRIDFIDSLSFDTALHLGTLLALLIFFFKDIKKYFLAFLSSFVKFDPRRNEDQRLAWLIAIATIPAGLAGLFLENIINTFLRSPWWVAGMLIGVAILFIIFEKFSKKWAEIKDLSWWQSIVIGVAQAIALIPGVSRSGITIITGMAFNLKREAAARFSFILSVPIVFGAGLKKVYDLGQAGMSNEQSYIFLIGLAVSAIVGWFAVKYLLKFLTSHSLNYFAYYRIAIGLAIIGWLVWGKFYA
ncbi:MAG: undecaprenyl-diphosphatase UppP [bacterium]